jgi:hypothetical protein
VSTVIRMWPVGSLIRPRARAGGRVGSGGQQKSIGERNRWARGAGKTSIGEAAGGTS